MELLTNRIREYMDRNGIKYERLIHRRDVTARQTAQDCHVDPVNFAKVVGLNADGSHILAVLPANYFIDLPKFKFLLGAGHPVDIEVDSWSDYGYSPG